MSLRLIPETSEEGEEMLGCPGLEEESMGSWCWVLATSFSIEKRCRSQETPGPPRPGNRASARTLTSCLHSNHHHIGDSPDLGGRLPSSPGKLGAPVGVSVLVPSQGMWPLTPVSISTSVVATGHEAQTQVALVVCKQ